MKTITEEILFDVPKGACDCHLHIIDPKYPNSGEADKHPGIVKDYKSVAKSLGIERAIFVQAKDFGTDNNCLLDGIKEFGIDNSRGVAVVTPDISEKELSDLYKGGVRGFRFSLWNPNNAVVTLDMMKPLAEKIKQFDMHIQIHMSGDQIVENEDLINSLGVTTVIDHMGRLNPNIGLEHSAFLAICKLIDKGNTWVKLSGAYLNTLQGSPYDDATKVAIGYANYAPERMVWGSDWPHVTEKIKPSDFELINLLTKWVPDESRRHLVLVDNPKELYGFK